ncbi:MAG: Gfo/Idh/MocA family oxidoreductase [Acidobacteria bacterium]|nr:Gfo/Idh/MocA family oxidoreductase [Acidobacteriota bacterium]
MSATRRVFLAASAAAGVMQGQKKVRTGILGIQHSHLAGKLQAMNGNPAFEVVSVCEPAAGTRKAKSGDAQLTRLRWVSMEEMLADRSLDLIVFEGEVKDAVPLGKRVLQAGKHLHLEKPPTNKLEPFRELVEIARKGKRCFQLGYLYRFHPGIDVAIDVAKKGWLGDVYMVRAAMNSDRDQKQRDVEARYPGGSMFELGGHLVDRVIAVLGRPAAVRTWLRHDTSVADSLKDNTLAVFEYPKAIATVVSSAKDPAMHRSFEVIGSEGTVLVNPLEPAPTVRLQLREPKGPYKKGVNEWTLPAEPRFVRDFADLGRAIQAGAALKYSYDHELALQETLLRASGEIV